MQNSKTCNTFFSYNDVCNQLVKFHGDPLYLKFLPYSPAMSGLKQTNHNLLSIIIINSTFY